MTGQTQADSLADYVLSYRQPWDEQVITTFYDTRLDAVWAGFQLRWGHAQEITVSPVGEVGSLGQARQELSAGQTLTYTGWVEVDSDTNSHQLS